MARGEKKSCISYFVDWIVDRLGAKEFTESIVPRHALHPIYSLGGLTTTMFILQAITGILLLIFYVPLFGESNIAYDSIVRINEEVAYGYVIRNLHSLGANLMIFLAILHFIRVYLTGSYKKPHEITYIVGILTGGLAILAGVTGYSLRMDHIAAEAINIGKNLVSHLPGGKILSFLVYGTGSPDEVVGRYMAYHILIAGAILLLMLIHFFSIHQHHISPPYDDSEPEPAIPFFPNHMLTELSAILVTLGALILVSAVMPAELGEKFLPTKELPVGQPEWYLMTVYAIIKTGIDPVLAGVVIPGIGILIFVLMPWIDPAYSRHPKNRRIATTYFFIFLSEFIVFFIYGTLTPGQQIPLLNAVALAIVVALVSGALALKYTSKSRPPQPKPKVKRVRFYPQLLKWLPHVFWILLILQAITLGYAVSYHLSEMYDMAAALFGVSIILFGWAFFVAKVYLLDAKYITRPVKSS